MKRTTSLFFLAALLAFAVIAAGCAPSERESQTGGEPIVEEEPTTTEGAEPGDETATEPSITFTEPEEGAEVSGPDVDVSVTVEGVDVVNKLNEPNVEGEGHLHWIVDGAAPVPSPETTFVAKGLKAGEHEVKAELHQNSHEPFDPPVESTVKFMVK